MYKKGRSQDLVIGGEVSVESEKVFGARSNYMR